MTRVNAGIKPSELVDKHLIAEYKEILRVNSMAINGYEKHGEAYISNLPEEFTLNTGHMKFFADKLEYIRNRFAQIKLEMMSRGFNVNINYEKPVSPDCLWGNYNPTYSARQLLVERILDRFPKNAKYYGKSITKDEYLENVLA